MIFNRYRFALIAGLVGMLALIGCSPALVFPTATATVPARLEPYHTSTPSPTAPIAQRTGTISPQPTATPTVTPTPFWHVLIKGDTLLGLALQYGVSLEAIKTANPEINPNLLIIGNQVIIPIQATPAPTQAPSPTPIAVQLAEPVCYPTGDGGMWCFALATNQQPFALENLAARIRLTDPDGQSLGRQTAILPLNRLPPGAALPLAAFFPPPVDAGAVPSIVQTDSLAISAADTRYLTTTLQIENVDIYPDGLQVDVQGSVLLPAGSVPANEIWVAVVAYDAAGKVVGVRKWEAAEALPPAGRLPFTITVYSLGPAITRVDAVVEARP